MTPFLFGDPAEPLFGVYHEAGGAPRDMGVVLCSSIGHEYMRSHWALRRLAERLAADGLPALRFDYFAVGDSAGACGEGDPQRWKADIRVAMDELRSMAAVRRTALVGIRIGAALAYDLAAGGGGVDVLVLWDPVVDGAAFMAQLAAMQRDRVRAFTGRKPTAADAAEPELLGFPYPPAMRAGLGAVDLLSTPPPAETPTHVIVSDMLPGGIALRDHLARHHPLATFRHAADFGNWEVETWSRRSLLGDVAPAAVVEVLSETRR